MRGVYTVTHNITGVSAAKTLIHVETPSDLVIEILSATITNRSIDANEMLHGGLFHITTNGTPVGTTIAVGDVAKHEQGDANTSLILLGNLTTEPTTYETLGIDEQGFSNLAGYRYYPVPEERAVVSPSSYAGLRLLAAPATAFDVTATITYREIGG